MFCNTNINKTVIFLKSTFNNINHIQNPILKKIGKSDTLKNKTNPKNTNHNTPYVSSHFTPRKMNFNHKLKIQQSTNEKIITQRTTKQQVIKDHQRSIST